MRLLTQQTTLTRGATKFIVGVPIAVLMVLFLCLAGCATKVVYVPQYVGALPPDALLLDCPAVPEPDSVLYLQKSWDGKEQMLTDTLNDNYGVIQVCNIQKSELREWKLEQQLILNAANKPAAR